MAISDFSLIIRCFSFVDMKCVCMQYIEAVGRLISQVNEGKVAAPLRTIHLSYLPDEEIGAFTTFEVVLACLLILRWR